MLDLVTPRTLTLGGPGVPEGPSGEPAHELKRVNGDDESLSDIYAYTLDCLTSPDLPPDAAANLDLKSMIGKERIVSIQPEGMGTFTPGLIAGASDKPADPTCACPDVRRTRSACKCALNQFYGTWTPGFQIIVIAI